jgi:hypothetical protein
MSTSVFYTNDKIEASVHVFACALVPAYLYAVHQLFCLFPDIKSSFFDKKNTPLGLSY